MATLFIDGTVAEDEWVSVEGEQPIPTGEDVIVSLAYFKSNEPALVNRNSGKLGVHLDTLDELDDIAPYLDSLSLVSLDFPSFANGTSYSKSHLLREKFGFKGEIRAVGDIRIDQVAFFKRCGVDSLVVTHQPTIDAMQSGRDPSIRQFYQPALNDSPSTNGRAWARRSV